VCVNIVEKAVYKTLPLRGRDFLNTSITEEELKKAVNRGFVTKLREETSSVWDFLKFTHTWTVLILTCWPYTPGST